MLAAQTRSSATGSGDHCKKAWLAPRLRVETVAEITKGTGGTLQDACNQGNDFGAC